MVKVEKKSIEVRGDDCYVMEDFMVIHCGNQIMWISMDDLKELLNAPEIRKVIQADRTA